MSQYKRIANRWYPVACLAGCIGLASSSPVLAQDQDAGVSSAAALEEITVTARKREESLQELALSVSAMGEMEIERNFATDVRDLIYISPNTVLDDTAQGPGGVAAAYIRGIGVSEVEKNFDPAVGVVVDGIFRGTMTGSIERAIDLERVEVLRGPQGTLFGRNTIGGVIQLQRTKPTMNFGGKVRAGYGNYDTGLLDGYFNIGNGETWGVKFSGAWKAQNEGYYENLVTGRDDGQYEYSSGGINALWAPIDGLELEWTYLLERTDQDTPPLLNVGQPNQLFCIAYHWCSPDTDTPVSGDRWKTLQAYGSDSLSPFPPNVPFSPPGYDEPHGPYDAKFDADTNQLEARWELNDAYRLDYIIGSWETEEKVVTDWDGVPQTLFHTDRPAEYEQLTNELRLTYDNGGNLAYTVGAYVWDSEYDIRLLSYIGFAPVPFVVTLPQFTHQESESWALFFEGDYAFSDAWTLTLGGRWTEDEKSTAQTGVVTATADASWSEFTPKLAVSFNLNDTSMIYGLYSAGYRAGGFNGRVDSIETATTPYDPETVDNFELGYRSEWMERRLIFNATGFYMDYEDKQEEIQQPSATSGTGQVTRVVNAASATITGAEFDLMYLAAEGLTLRANLGLLNAEYDDFLVNLGSTQNPNFTDLSHLDFRRAPELTFSLGGDYQWTMGPGTGVVQATWHYIDEHEVDFANKPELHNESQNMVDASFTYLVNDWYFSAYGRNLLEEDGYQIGFDVAGLWSYAATRPPRTYGIEVGLRFGD